MKKYLSESIELLERIKGLNIIRMIRPFYGDVDLFMKNFPRVQEREIFAFSGYSLFIKFEVLGWVAFAECERELSIVMWQFDELTRLKVFPDSEVNNISGQKYIECSDETYSESYWADFIGTKISGMKIISLSVDRENIRSFKNERGLWMVNDSGADLIVETSLAEKGIPGGLNLIRKNQIRTQLLGDLAFRNV
ncbi:hypothetical protein [Janthinobacterium sp. RT4P48]|uniref:hypothetical protein n=1 Tax=Janthinobacterium sp. RT4P48 TaxID=3424188 RepID=UPI003F212BBA